jgi:hypothetical protein
VVAAVGIVDPEADRHVLEELGVILEVGGHVEDELIAACREIATQQGADAAVVIGLRFGHQVRLSVILKPEERHRYAHGGLTAAQVQDVGADGGARIGHCYPPHMGDLRISVGDLHFTARWEADAPLTRAALRAWLPISSQLIHCRWSGESTWIPFGDSRPEVSYENATAHPAPGDMLIYVGDLSECEILFPYGACAFSSKVGPLAGNHFATLEPDEGWRERLREVGRRVLWQGAQDIAISEAD